MMAVMADDDDDDDTDDDDDDENADECALSNAVAATALSTR